MIMHDFNKEGEKVILLLHPMLASGEMMYDIIGKNLGENIRVLAPDFASHGREQDKDFGNADFEADKILSYLKENNIKNIDFAYGASLGGVVLTKLIRKNLSFSKAFFEGTSFYIKAKCMTKILEKIFIKKHKRAVADYNRAINAMGELYGEKYAKDFADQFIAMSEESIRKIAIACGDNEPASLSPSEQEKCTFAYGTKDFNYSKAKKGVKKYYPNAKFIQWEGFDHCEKITADRENYINILKEYLN